MGPEIHEPWPCSGHLGGRVSRSHLWFQPPQRQQLEVGSDKKSSLSIRHNEVSALLMHWRRYNISKATRIEDCRAAPGRKKNA